MLFRSVGRASRQVGTGAGRTVIVRLTCKHMKTRVVSSGLMFQGALLSELIGCPPRPRHNRVRCSLLRRNHSSVRRTVQ